jgi:phage terminase small subunit
MPDPTITKQKKFSDLSDKRRKFVFLRARGRSPIEAYEEAGFSTEGARWSNTAYLYNRELALHIRAKITESIGTYAVEAIDVVHEIMVDVEENSNVRLACAKEMMSRAWGDNIMQVNLSDERTKTVKDLDAEITALLETVKKEKSEEEAIEAEFSRLTH